MKIKQNAGLLDRILRIGFSGFMLYLGFLEHSIVTDEITEIILSLFGGAIFITALVGNCPLYEVIGLNTCSHRQKNNAYTNT
jgi:hypothetical protein